MELLQLTNKQIRTIYLERIKKDFAPDEIKPLSRIRKALAEGNYACYGAFEGEQITAYAFFVLNGRCALVDYLAVREDLRGQGTGSRFLQLMMSGLMQQFDCVLLESEDPDFAEAEEEKDIRNRRLRFYLRNGLTDTGVTAFVWHGHYRILALPVGKALFPDNVREIYSDIYHIIFPKIIYDRMVQL